MLTPVYEWWAVIQEVREAINVMEPVTPGMLRHGPACVAYPPGPDPGNVQTLDVFVAHDMVPEPIHPIPGGFLTTHLAFDLAFDSHDTIFPRLVLFAAGYLAMNRFAIHL
jgi:hypothetical protein